MNRPVSFGRRSHDALFGDALFGDALFGIASLAAVLAGCAGADSNNPQVPLCNPPCVAPMYCDPVQRTCVQGGNQCTGTQTWCRGVCVETLSDAKNCGGCGNNCGYNASCTGGQCACVGTFNNCDGFWSNGCECGGACSGRACAPPPQTGCDPNSESDCDADHYCDITTKECVQCPLGQKNCDLKSDCECVSDGCDGKSCKAPDGACDPDAKASCGDDPKNFCNQSTRMCMECGAGFLNCDKDSICECEGLCDGEKCATCDPATVGACNNVGTYDVYCKSGQEEGVCRTCDDGKKNCDGKHGCECSTVCNGTECKKEETPCDPTKAGDCGDDGKYCNATTKKCDNCPSGKKNCDKIGTCDCDFTCSGTTCETPCTYDGLNACGNDSNQWCYNGECRACTTNFFNCDHTKGCECSGGCNGTQCQSACNSCDGCCDAGTCLSKSAQSWKKCGAGGKDCVECPTGQFCKDGACVDCATNCAQGCCTVFGDCYPHADQSYTTCGTGGAQCANCGGPAYTCFNGQCTLSV